MVPPSIHGERVLAVITHLADLVRHPQRVLHDAFSSVLINALGHPPHVLLVFRVDVNRHLRVNSCVRIRKLEQARLWVLLHEELIRGLWLTTTLEHLSTHAFADTSQFLQYQEFPL
jgi:hypothetical protein